MTYEKLVDKVKKAYAGADASKISGHVAIQVNVSGEAEGIFYIEISEGKVNVEPYDYVDNDMVIFTPEKEIVDIATGKVSIDDALAAGKISVAGHNIDGGLQIREVVLKKAAKAEKAPAKKPAAKKTATKKTTKTEKAVAKAEVKAEAKPVKEEKVVVKAAEVKAEPAKAEKEPAKKPVAKATETKAAKKPAAKKAKK